MKMAQNCVWRVWCVCESVWEREVRRERERERERETERERQREKKGDR
jgi:hypothetical protein